jgi:hypothetical protein
MPVAPADTLTLALTNIEVGPVVQQRRPDPCDADPARTILRPTRDYHLTFKTEAPGVSASFVVHVGWDAKGSDSCPIEQLEEVGQMIVRDFAGRVAL